MKRENDMKNGSTYNDYNKYFSQGEYSNFEEINFSILINGMKKLPFYKDDVALGMQAMNIGITDSVITEYEYSMLDAFNKDEDTKNLMLITSVRRLG